MMNTIIIKIVIVITIILDTNREQRRCGWRRGEFNVAHYSGLQILICILIKWLERPRSTNIDLNIDQNVGISGGNDPGRQILIWIMIKMSFMTFSQITNPSSMVISRSSSECDISSRDFPVSRLFSIFGEYQSRSRKQVSISVSKIFGLKKNSRCRSRKYLVSKKSLVSVSKMLASKKSLGIGLKNFGLKKFSVTTSKNLVSKKPR